MLRYNVKVDNFLSGELILPSERPNLHAPIEYKGLEYFVETMRGLLDGSYGAFGHRLSGEEANPIDLDCALCQLKQQGKIINFERIEGQELVSDYDPGIPKGAKT